ncbi:MAG: hypothetical protein ACYTG0_06070 [Planctomycetota bacterium]|jgi:hypothetical protein
MVDIGAAIEAGADEAVRIAAVLAKVEEGTNEPDEDVSVEKIARQIGSLYATRNVPLGANELAGIAMALAPLTARNWEEWWHFHCFLGEVCFDDLAWCLWNEPLPDTTGLQFTEVTGAFQREPPPDEHDYAAGPIEDQLSHQVGVRP